MISDKMLVPSSITPLTVDRVRRCKWWQYVNGHGTHMTRVVDTDSAWSIESNEYQVGCLPSAALDRLLAKLRASISGPSASAAGNHNTPSGSRGEGQLLPTTPPPEASLTATSRGWISGCVDCGCDQRGEHGRCEACEVACAGGAA